MHPNINARDSRLRIHDRIRKAQIEWKGVELSAKSIGKGLHKVCKVVVKELNNSLTSLGSSGSEVSHFIP